MPIIRNSVLMTLSHKTAAELLEKDGKLKLSRELRREAAKALGMEPPPDDDQPASGAKRKAPAPEDISPVIGVHFSNFIIQ
jgi:flagellar FliL protein